MPPHGVITSGVHIMKPLAAVVLALGIGVAVHAEDKKTESPKIAGTYKLVSGKKNGTPVGDDAKKPKYVIDEKTITIGEKDEKFVMSYKLDGDKIDMVIDEAPFDGLKGSKGYGIVAVKDGTLKLAYGTEKEANRPKDFAGKDGFYFEFKKEKAKE
jgi:uncharacterized protein (TIGR03067 family)